MLHASPRCQGDAAQDIRLAFGERNNMEVWKSVFDQQPCGEVSVVVSTSLRLDRGQK